MPPTLDAAAHRRVMLKTITRMGQSFAREGGRPLDPRVMEAMARIPREAFVPGVTPYKAYANGPLPIGLGQTISQPFIVALMSSLARIAPSDRVLEIGTGSGYQTAILAALAAHVHSVEVIDQLGTRAATALRTLGIDNVTMTIGDGHRGWPDHAPYDAIVVTAAPAEVPPDLIQQLAPGGRLVTPVGAGDQTLVLIEKSAAGVVHQDRIIAVRFVPLLTSGNPD